MKVRRLVVLLFLACAVCTWADGAWYPISDDEEYLLALLSSEDARERYQALSALESAATERSVPTLVGLVETADLGEAAIAVRILGKLGDSRSAPVILQRLEETLEAYTSSPPTPDVTGLSASEAWEVLKEQDEAGDTSSERSSFIWAGCMALGQVSPEDALAVLPEIMETPAFEGRFTYGALMGLGYTRDDRAVPFIVAELSSLENLYDVRCILDALVQIGSPAAVDAICGLITEPATPHRDEVVADAGRALHNPDTYYGAPVTMDQEGTRRVEEALWWVGTEDPDPEYRLLALMTMAVNYQNTDEEAASLLDLIEAETGTYLISLKMDYDLVFDNFRIKHRELAGRLLVGALENASDKDDIVLLLTELEHISPKLNPLPPPEGLWDLLVGLTGNPEAEVRGVCLRALAGVYGTDAAPFVLDAFDDPSSGVRWEAADVYASSELAGADWDSACARLAAGWGSAYDFIFDAAEHEENRSVYEVMVKALVSTGDPRAVEVLAGIFEGAVPDDRDTRVAMLQMLTGMAIPEADAAIARLAETDEERRYVRLRQTPPQEVSDPDVLVSDYIKNPASRYRGYAARRYAELVGPEAVDVILDYISTEDDPRERGQGYFGLRLAGSPIPVERLIPLLEDEDNPRNLSEAIRTLLNDYDEDAVSFLIDKLRDEFAARVDGSHPMFQPKSDDPFASTDYNDFNYNDCYAKLMQKLTEFAPNEALPILLDIYRRDPVEESRAAAYGLALTTDPAGVVGLIREGLENPDAGVRYNALRLVPEYLGDEAVGIVTRFIDDPGFDVKFAAIRMIVDLLGPDATEIIAPQLESPNYHIRDRVGKYLADWGDPRAFEYYYGLWDGRIVHKLTADIIGNLAKYDDPRGWEVIREVCEIGGQSNDVCYAWLLRARHGDPEAREFLLASIDDEDLNHGARDEVFEGLRYFEDDEVREAIERVAYDETLHWTRRDCAWETLAYWQDPRARDFWLECLAGEDTLRRITAVTALSYYDDPEVWELIRHAAENDPDRQVVKEAQKQLDKREGE